MPLKDHYLVEDYGMMADHLETLHKSFSKALDCATNAEFSSKESILQAVNDSMNILMALHAKKQQRDEIEKAGYKRRNWY